MQADKTWPCCYTHNLCQRAIGYRSQNLTKVKWWVGGHECSATALAPLALTPPMQHQWTTWHNMAMCVCSQTETWDKLTTPDTVMKPWIFFSPSKGTVNSIIHPRYQNKMFSWSLGHEVKIWFCGHLASTWLERGQPSAYVLLQQMIPLDINHFLISPTWHRVH